MVKGYDPISMTDKDSLKEWLSDSEDNIVIFIDDMKSLSAERNALCLKKSYFLNPHMNDIYKECIIENRALMVKETYDEPIDFRNIGFYMNKYLMINNREFIETLKKGRVFDLKDGTTNKVLYIRFPKGTKPGSKWNLKYEGVPYSGVEYPYEFPVLHWQCPKEGIPVSHPVSKTEFISQEALEMSQFGLKPDNMIIQKKKIWTHYPKTHPAPGTKFVVNGYEGGAYAQNKKYTGVQFPPVSDDQLGKIIQIDVLDLDADIKNIPYKEQVYFNDVIATALYDYSFQWDGAINWYLRQGEEYFNSSIYKTYSFRFGDPNFKTDRQSMEIIIKGVNTIAKIKKLLSNEKIEYDTKIVKKKADLKKLLQGILTKMDKENFELGKKNVKDHILQIDKCFLEYAPRVTTAMSNKYYYRGMTQKYTGQDKVGGEFIVDNFGSVSESELVGKTFGIRRVPTAADGTRCCFYRIKLQKGMPYINMINNTQFKQEVEILLPRNIKFKLRKITENASPDHYKYNIYTVDVSMIKKDQFKIETGCKTYGIVELSLRDDPKLSSTESGEIKTPASWASESKKADHIEANKINKELDPKVHKIKLPRCPKGTYRSKKTGECKPKKDKLHKLKQTKKISHHKDLAVDLKETKKAPEQTKKKRCPKGTYRSKKTGECKPKKDKLQKPKQTKKISQPKDKENDTPKKSPQKTKKKRCPNGMYRSKKTGECKPKKK